MTPEEKHGLMNVYPTLKKLCDETMEKCHVLPTKEDVGRPHTCEEYSNRAAFSGGALHALDILLNTIKPTQKKAAPRTRHLKFEEPIS